MGFWVFMFCCDLLTPALMILSGRWMWKHPPKEVNSLVGYRTRRSMQNEDTWRFANEYAGKLFWKLGIWMLIPSVLLPLVTLGKDESTIADFGVVLLMIQCAIMVAAIFPTEWALKRTFDEEGNFR